MLTDIPQSETSDRKQRIGGNALLALPLLLVGYVLSFGPALRMALQAKSPGVAKVVDVAYAPITWSMHRYPLVSEIINAWLSLWITRDVLGLPPPEQMFPNYNAAPD